jgi:hypothetical protein
MLKYLCGDMKKTIKEFTSLWLRMKLLYQVEADEETLQEIVFRRQGEHVLKDILHALNFIMPKN